jgi:hypothetical protein
MPKSKYAQAKRPYFGVFAQLQQCFARFAASRELAAVDWHDVRK